MTFHMDVVSINYMEQFSAADHAAYTQMCFILSEAATNGGAKWWCRFDKRYVAGQSY